ncbi:hypothetical protein [uncultured Helicobacter sp.]|uniref:hypothetical protein n=1 Tax=uncultured Helicobacter sp. TaxID=175537 RepID=UPI0026016DA2|nr:hypothetical protein [uncultured Helicobacter sp.]
MALFQVNMPQVPDSVAIHNIADTPLLKRAKLILVTTYLVSFCVAFSFIFWSGYKEITVIPPELNIFLNIFSACSFIALFIVFFYFSKLSLRRRIFNLYIVVFAITLIGAIINFIVPQDIDDLLSKDSEGSLAVAALFLYTCIALPVYFYIFWQMGKELSFILNDACFFKGTKMMVISFIAMLVELVFTMVALGLKSEALIVIVALLLLATCILLIVGCILYLIAVFRIHQIIAYGEQIPNTIS